MVLAEQIIFKGVRSDLSVTDSSSKLELSTFFGLVQVTTYLSLVLLVVGGTRWIFNLCDVAVFGVVGGPLYQCPTFTYTSGNTLQKFKLWNIPVVDNSISLPYSCTSFDDGVFVLMKFF
jgi:hypothetical protein